MKMRLHSSTLIALSAALCLAQSASAAITVLTVPWVPATPTTPHTTYAANGTEATIVMVATVPSAHRRRIPSLTAGPSVMAHPKRHRL